MPVVLAPLAAVGIAIIALLIMLGAALLAKWIAHIIPRNIPVIGSWIADRVEGLANLAVASIQGFLSDAVHPVVKLMTAPFTVIGRLYDVATSTLNQMYATLRAIVTATIPRAIATAERYTVNAVAALKRYVQDLVGTVERRLTALINAARAYAASLVADLKRYVQDLVATVERQLIRLIDQVRTYAEDLVRAAEAAAAAALARAVHNLTALITDLRTFVVDSVRTLEDLIAGRFAQAERDALAAAKAAEAGAIATVDGAVTSALAGVWPALVTDVDALAGEWADVFPDILAGGLDWAKVIPRDLAGEVAITGALAGVLTRYLRECGLPNCRNLGGLGRELQALLGIVEDGSFLALIVALATDPKGAARTVDAVFGPVARATTNGVADLIGVR